MKNLDKESIIDHILVILHKNRITQKEFAASIGVTDGAVCKWVNGITTPKRANIKKINDVYKEDFSSIVDGSPAASVSPDAQQPLFGSSIPNVPASVHANTGEITFKITDFMLLMEEVYKKVHHIN